MHVTQLTKRTTHQLGPPSPPRIANKNPPEIDADCTATICWLPVSDDGGNTGTLHYNVYTYDSLRDRYIKINDDEIKGGNNGKDDVICYEFEVESGDTSLSVVVTSASVATGDLEVIEDLADILGGSIFFQIMKQSSKCELIRKCCINPTISLRQLCPRFTVTVTVMGKFINFKVCTSQIMFVLCVNV